MADKDKKATLTSLLVFAALIAICVWIGMIVAAKGEQRLQQACKPVEYSTQLLHEITFALVGGQPTWTLYIQRYLMTGCYYAFSVLFSQQQTPFGPGSESGQAAPAGGIQTN